MSIVRWQPRSVIRPQAATGLSQEFDRLFDWAFGDDLAPSGWSGPMVPAIDVTEDDNRYVIHADLPGLSKADIEVTYHNGCLTLKGEKKVETTEEKKGRVYHRERFTGKFGRNIQLPEKIDAAKIEASFKDGVLELVLPFTPEAQPRKIQINE